MKALDKQVGGDHYKKYKIQPIEFTIANKLSFLQGNIVKYVTRFQDKNGIEDLTKVLHYIDFMIQSYDHSFFHKVKRWLLVNNWIKLKIRPIDYGVDNDLLTAVRGIINCVVLYDERRDLDNAKSLTTLLIARIKRGEIKEFSCDK